MHNRQACDQLSARARSLGSTSFETRKLRCCVYCCSVSFTFTSNCLLRGRNALQAYGTYSGGRRTVAAHRRHRKKMAPQTRGLRCAHHRPWGVGLNRDLKTKAALSLTYSTSCCVRCCVTLFCDYKTSSLQWSCIWMAMMQSSIRFARFVKICAADRAKSVAYVGRGHLPVVVLWQDTLFPTFLDRAFQVWSRHRPLALHAN